MVDVGTVTERYPIMIPGSHKSASAAAQRERATPIAVPELGQFNPATTRKRNITWNEKKVGQSLQWSED